MRGLSRAAWGLVIALGCGGSNGSTDPTQAFVGVWKGTGISTTGGQSTSRQLTIPIEEVSPSTLKLHGFCGSGTDIYSDGPTASVNGHSFTLTPGSCTYTAQSCGPTTLDVTGGNGVLTTGLPSTLSLSVNATFTTCGNSSTQLVTFTSTTKQAYGTNARVPEESPVAAGALGLR
jgi:hypothetical protein